jgi:hypothetical protein
MNYGNRTEKKLNGKKTNKGNQAAEAVRTNLQQTTGRQNNVNF